ncbi:hypothetical protein ACJMK2_004651 [Sinanodonta woodiana]|uniref:Uncharacterized protein n=1 Tax=Sinanodonta woodiana TaxID=1069815 RepID=A0ABD3Y1V4_SINWO
MKNEIYNALKNVSRECTNCGLPNFSTSLFNTSIFETSNTFSYLDDSNTNSEISFSHPTATSSPSKVKTKRDDFPLRALIINCQSIQIPGKHAELASTIDSTQVDIIIGTESWLKPFIKSQEVFPAELNCYRKDRSTGEGGGVFILISNKYDSEEPEFLKVNNDCELVWAKIKATGAKDL